MTIQIFEEIKQEAIEEGIKEGIKKGIKEGIEKVATKMKKENMNTQTIIKLTGLTKEEINNL